MSARLLQAVHARWAAAESLAALLPAARLATGMNADASLPRAIVSQEAAEPLAACNDGTAVESVAVRFQVFHESYDAAAAIAWQIRLAFDRADFELADGHRVIHMRRTGESHAQQDDGAWRLVIDFACMVHRPAP